MSTVYGKVCPKKYKLGFKNRTACEKACPKNIKWVLKISKKYFNCREGPLASCPLSPHVLRAW